MWIQRALVSCSKSTKNRTLGFTIVELIVVIMLLGILSITAMSRWVEPSALAPRTISTAIMAQGHYAAQNAQAGVDGVALVVGKVGDIWRIDVRNGAVSLRSSGIDAANTRIEIANDGSIYDVDAGATLSMVFTGDGDVQGGTVGANVLNAGAGIEIRTIGDTTQWLCFYPTGHAGARAC